MNILKNNFLKQNLKTELKVVKNSLIRASAMNPSISFKNVNSNAINVSKDFMVCSQKLQNSINLFSFAKYRFSSGITSIFNI